VRGNGWDRGSCADIGYVAIKMDGVEPNAGYRFEIADGAVLPDDERLTPAEALWARASEDQGVQDSFYFHWLDGANDEQEPIAFDVRVIPVGTAGDGTPSEWLTVTDPGNPSSEDRGCAIVAERNGGWAWLAVSWLAALGLCRRRAALRARRSALRVMAAFTETPRARKESGVRVDHRVRAPGCE
jgi:hypothetical protein